MGALGVNGSGDGSQHIDPPEADAAPPVADDGKGRGDDGRFVPAAQLQPETQASRRERQWQERVNTVVEPMRKEWGDKLTAAETRLEEERRARQEHATELARMRGMLEAMQRQPQQAPQQAQGPDPDALFAPPAPDVKPRAAGGLQRHGCEAGAGGRGQGA